MIIKKKIKKKLMNVLLSRTPIQTLTRTVFAPVLYTT